MKIIISRLFALALAASLILSVNPSSALAWDQHPTNYATHQEINYQAFLRFIEKYENDAKYANNGSSPNAAIDKAKSYLGPKVVSNTTFERTPSALLTPDSGHIVKQESLTFERWVVHGGYSADEPNFWASVRHFYNPLPENGPPELNDQTAFKAVYTAISARDWTFKRADNPFGWKKALEYYKQAMEIPQDIGINEIMGSDLRDIALRVSSPAEARENYLGKSFRSLGETMHMLADLTQPAHVRNDSHPFFDTDPLEAVIKYSHVQKYANSPVDPEIGNDINAAGADAESMYDAIAKYTNKNFYSNDTICDKASGVLPNKGEKPYMHPQFSDLVWNKETKTYSKNFTFLDHLVPMIQQKYTSNEHGGTGTNTTTTGGPDISSTPNQYIVPPRFAEGQAEVLLPIAIKADTKLIDLFFPTMKLAIDARENEKWSTSSYKEFLVTGEMKHLIDKDVEWKKRNMEIKYYGPAELWCERKGKVLHIGDTVFKGGQIPFEQPLIVCAGEAPRKTTDPNVKIYQVEHGDTLYLVINAGGRIFTSNKFPIVAETKITTGKWVLDGAPVIDNKMHNDDRFTKLIKAEIKQGSATYNVNHIHSDGHVMGTSKADFTFTQAPRELVPGSKMEFTVSGEYSGTGNCYPVQCGMSSQEINDYGYNSYLNVGTSISDTKRKDVMTKSFYIPTKDEFNKGKMHFIYRLDGPAGLQTITYNYK